MIICIIQARMGSTRLPGKALKDICGKPLLEHVCSRVKKSRLIDKIVIATTIEPSDDVIEKLGRSMKIDVFRGDRDDVLDRFYNCARKFGADVIVRITGDCPMIDPSVIDDTIDYFTTHKVDYASNAYPVATYPDGLDTEVFTFPALEKAWKAASLASDREHVTAYIWNNRGNAFRIGSVRFGRDLSAKRWTVDNKADLKFVKKIYGALYDDNPFFDMKDVLKLLEDNPELEKINNGTGRNEGYSKSLSEDRKKPYAKKN